MFSALQGRHLHLSSLEAHLFHKSNENSKLTFSNFSLKMPSHPPFNVFTPCQIYFIPNFHFQFNSQCFHSFNLRKEFHSKFLINSYTTTSKSTSAMGIKYTPPIMWCYMYIFRSHDFISESQLFISLHFDHIYLYHNLINFNFVVHIQ